MNIHKYFIRIKSYIGLLQLFWYADPFMRACVNKDQGGAIVELQTKEYFEEGSGNIKIERNILSMSDPDKKIEINEYMVGCYGTTEYPEDMTGITLGCVGDKTKTIDYNYKCREEEEEGAKEVYAVIP